MSEKAIDFARAVEVQGESHPSLNAVHLVIEESDGRTARLSVPAHDIQRVVGLMLLLGRQLPAKHSSGEIPLIPGDSLSVGELPTGEILLAIQVGASTLGFALPPRAAATLGRSLMATESTTSMQ